MEKLSVICFVAFVVAASTTAFAAFGDEFPMKACSVEGIVCPLTIDNVLEIDTEGLMTSASGCQYFCFRERACQNFTFFQSSSGETRCVLFRDCPTTSFCQRCLTGPARPTTDGCAKQRRQLQQQHQQRQQQLQQLNEISDRQDAVEEDEDELSITTTTAALASSAALPTPESPVKEEAPPAETAETPEPAATPAESSEVSDSEEVGDDDNKDDDAEIVPENPTAVAPTVQEIRRPKQFDDDAEGEGDGSDEAADQLNVEGVDDGLLEEDEPSSNETSPGSPPKKDREETTAKPNASKATARPVTTPAARLKPEKQEKETADDEDDEKDPNDDAEAFDDDYFEDTLSDNDNQDGVGGSSGNNKTVPAFFHCIIGGYGVHGPVSTLSHFGSSVLNRAIIPAPLLAPLPPSFPLGDEGVFSTMYSRSLYVCSPGAASTNDQFFSFFGGPTRSLFPGRCVTYDNTTDLWLPFGNPMNTFRGGAAFTRMGKFIVATGGRRFPATLNSIEVLNTEKPQNWRQLSKLTLPNPTYDHCVVALNKTAIFLSGGFGQESHTMMIDMKDKRTISLDPMKQPRRQHHCQKAQINGREGIIVAGGSTDNHPALASVEFYDLDLGRWLNLGKLREPRRFPSVLVMSNHLIIAGGETTDPFGRTVILDSIEALQGRRWIPLKQRLPEGRSRFVTQRIPKSFFF